MNVVSVMAHQDDELMCLGTMIKMKKQGYKLHFICLIFSAIPQKPAIDLLKVHVKELNICGSCNDMDYLDRAIEYLQDESLRLKEVITHKLPFGGSCLCVHLVSPEAG